MDPVPIPILNSRDDSSPNSPLRRHAKDVSTSFVENVDTQIIRR